jgi:hypothetical protein
MHMTPFLSSKQPFTAWDSHESKHKPHPMHFSSSISARNFLEVACAMIKKSIENPINMFFFKKRGNEVKGFKK